MSRRIDTAGSAAPRAAVGREWEAFVREDEAGPLRHVGSVNAPTERAAREQARQLLGWSATDVWLCPADEIRRFSTTER